MDQGVIERQLNELVDHIGSIPTRAKKTPVIGKSTHRGNEQADKNPDKLQDSLDYLRISVKYLLFDLDVTNRENRALRKLVNDQQDD